MAESHPRRKWALVKLQPDLLAHRAAPGLVTMLLSGGLGSPSGNGMRLKSVWTGRGELASDMCTEYQLCTRRHSSSWELVGNKERPSLELTF